MIQPSRAEVVEEIFRTVNSFEVMAFICQLEIEPPQKFGHLDAAAVANVSSSTISRQLQSLEAMGMIERLPNDVTSDCTRARGRPKETFIRTASPGWEIISAALRFIKPE